MGETSALRRCTASYNGGRFCNRPSIPDAPYPICTRHAAQVVRFVSTIIADKIGNDAVETTFDLFAKFGTILGRIDDSPHRERPEQTYCVYYIALNGVIKIGYTRNLTGRLGGYPPYAKLLATEPGGPEIEDMRLGQFAHLLAYGKEWFRDEPELREHIASIVAQHGEPAAA